MEFEDILEHAGGYGKFQRNLTILFLAPIYCLVPWFWLNKIFMLSVPEHWCNVPELEFYNLSIEAKRNLISPPNDSSCSMYNVNYTDLLSKGFLKTPNDSEIIPCIAGWQYDTVNYEHTSATKVSFIIHKIILYNFWNFVGKSLSRNVIRNRKLTWDSDVNTAF